MSLPHAAQLQLLIEQGLKEVEANLEKNAQDIAARLEDRREAHNTAWEQFSEEARQEIPDILWRYIVLPALKEDSYVDQYPNEWTEQLTLMGIDDLAPVELFFSRSYQEPRSPGPWKFVGAAPWQLLFSQADGDPYLSKLRLSAIEGVPISTILGMAHKANLDYRAAVDNQIALAKARMERPAPKKAVSLGDSLVEAMRTIAREEINNAALDS